MAMFGIRNNGRLILINFEVKESFSGDVETMTRPASDKSRSNQVFQIPPPFDPRLLGDNRL